MSVRREVYFEFLSLGGQVKASAIDGESGVEVSVVAPTHVGETELKKLCLAKLDRRLRQLSGDSDDNAGRKHSGNSGPGILV